MPIQVNKGLWDEYADSYGRELEKHKRALERWTLNVGHSPPKARKPPTKEIDKIGTGPHVIDTFGRVFALTGDGLMRKNGARFPHALVGGTVLMLIGGATGLTWVGVIGFLVYVVAMVQVVSKVVGERRASKDVLPALDKGPWLMDWDLISLDPKVEVSTSDLTGMSDSYVETMIFGGPHDGECWRTGTRDEGYYTHSVVVSCLQGDDYALIEKLVGGDAAHVKPSIQEKISRTSSGRRYDHKWAKQMDKEIAAVFAVPLPKPSDARQSVLPQVYSNDSGALTLFRQKLRAEVHAKNLADFGISGLIDSLHEDLNRLMLKHSNAKARDDAKMEAHYARLLDETEREIRRLYKALDARFDIGQRPG